MIRWRLYLIFFNFSINNDFLIPKVFEFSISFSNQLLIFFLVFETILSLLSFDQAELKFWYVRFVFIFFF